MKPPSLSKAFRSRLHCSGPLPTTLCCLLLLALLSACGKKGPVQPLSGVVPEPPGNPKIIQQGDSLLLSWGLPDGETAGDIRSYRIDRLAYAAEDGCPSCREPNETVTRISLRGREAGQQVNQRLYWRDTRVASGSGYFYRIVPEAFGGREGDAVTVYRTLLPAPSPPSPPEADVGRDQAIINWGPPPTLPDGAQPAGYNLYRRSLSGLFPPVPLNPEPLATPAVVDRGLEAGRNYSYRVTLLVLIGEVLVESLPSDILEVRLPEAGQAD